MAIRGGYKVLQRNESESRAGVWYEIREGSDGVVYCNCRAWCFRKTCRHLDAFKIEYPQYGQSQ